MGVVMGHTILEMDEPEHRKYRTLLQQAFTKKSLEHWEHELVRPVIDRLIDKFIDRGRAELVTELTLPFPVDVIGGLFGIPEEEMKQFHVWTVELISVGPRLRRRNQRVEADPRPPQGAARGAPRPKAASARTCSRSWVGPNSTATGSPTTRSSPSAAYCCPPAPRPPTGRRATSSTGCSPTLNSSTSCAPTRPR